MSCRTWQLYKGTWMKEKNTLFFYDNYEVLENDVKVSYGRAAKQSFVIELKTDRGSPLKNRQVRIQFFYDYATHLPEGDTTLSLNDADKLEIPFKHVPNLEKLASIRVEYQLSSEDKRYCFLTKSHTVNLKKGDVPNVAKVRFIEKPKREIAYRVSKATLKNNTLTVVATTKTKTILPDYHRDIKFESSYSLEK